MRVELTLPWPHIPASAWESPAVLGGGTQFLFRRKGEPPASAQRVKPGEPLLREGPSREGYQNKGNNIVALACHQRRWKIRLNEKNKNHHVSCYIIKCERYSKTVQSKSLANGSSPAQEQRKWLWALP